MARRLEVAIESWPLASAFTISRGSKNQADVVVVTLHDGAHTGRGECLPYPRYHQTPEAVRAEIATGPADLDRAALSTSMLSAAARNAIDCALWDLEAKRTGTPAHVTAGLPTLKPQVTCYTLSLDAPDAMAAAALGCGLPLLKLKLGGGAASLDVERMRAVRAARRDARLVADANEGWREQDLEQLLDAAAANGLELVEQPLPEGRDGALARVRHAVPVCADESAHTVDGLDALVGRYDAVNIKLDKTGGLTGALAMAERARALGLGVMVGSMVATSLSMAPAFLVAQKARWVDLDSPLLLARDRAPGMVIRDGVVLPPAPELWG
jgi:L-alanine-DL-glutamate epimerase-like enolase superfamily enzyme